MTMLSALTFSGTGWVWPAAIAGLLALLLVLWSYLRAAPVGGWRWACVGLKALGIALLAFCLLEPLWTGQRARPGANLFVVLADNSQGLQVKDRGETRSRGEVLRELVESRSGNWPEQLEADFEVRRFYFDQRLHATRDFSELTFDGRSTALGAALRGVAERFAGRPVAGILLFTDGNATDLRDIAQLPPGLPPVHPVVVGQAGAVRDLAVGQVQISQTAFEDAPINLRSDVTATGVSGEPVVAQLLDTTGRVVQEQLLRPRKPEETLAFRFQLRPEKPGLSFYQLRVAAREERAPTVGEAETREATLLNNTRMLPVDRGQGPYRILYVAGRPNWEFKFFNRALQEDGQVQLVALIRVALREPKFEFIGRAGETGNPLFRGFGDQSREEVERYDQPVLTRLNTRDELELRGGFPRTPEELFTYDAVVLDDIEAAFFGADQAALLQRFVSERGGGLLMLGGAECFAEGGYHRTPIGDALPVYLDRAENPSAASPKRLDLHREGWLQAWARLRDNEGDERARIEGMPPFQVFNRIRDVKPGASVVAVGRDEAGQEQPALVTQRFGRGRTAAFLVGDVWRWGMRDADARRDMDKAWRQLTRWLVADVPRRIEMSVEDQEPVGTGAVRLNVRVRNPAFAPLDDATVNIEVEPVLLAGSTAPTNTIRLRAEPSLKEAGLYEASFVPRDSGAYRATAIGTGPDGVEIGRVQAGWSTDLAAEEFRSLQPNVPLLGAIARATGGEVVPMSGVSGFVRDLPTRSAPVMEPTTSPLWHTPWVFLLALGCFAAEWGVRRWKGLP